MNILFLFVDLHNVENGDGLFSSLVMEFKNQGHNVCVATRCYEEIKSILSKEGGIDVLRVKSNEFTGVSNNIKKALAYQEYTIKQTFLVKKYFKKKKFDLIISHSLPPELAFEISILKKFFKCKFYLLQTDFTWQDAVSYGYFKKNGPIAWYYRFWERRLFKLADYIGCPTQGNIDFIHKAYPWIRLEKFHLIDFWSKFINIEKSDKIREKLGLNGKFVAIYGGSIGVAQKLEHLIDLADSCKEKKDIVFLILGRGAQLEKIKQLAEKKNLENIQFISFLPQNDYLQLLSSCNIGFVILNEKMATPNFPSKTLSYFNLQIPILASIDYVTDYGKFLDKTKTGLWSYSGDIESFKKNLLKLYSDSQLCEEFKSNQIKYFKDNMQPHNAYKKIIEHLENV